MGQRLDALEKGEGKKTSKIKSTMSRSKSKAQSNEQSQVVQNTGSGATSSANESVTDLNALCQDTHVQQHVQQRLLELNEIATSGMSSKIKS